MQKFHTSGLSIHYAYEKASTHPGYRFSRAHKAEMDDIVENIEAANTKKQTNTAVRTCE
jgi:hypothetical protein